MRMGRYILDDTVSVVSKVQFSIVAAAQDFLYFSCSPGLLGHIFEEISAQLRKSKYMVRSTLLCLFF